MRSSRPFRNLSMLLVLMILLAACAAPTTPPPTAAPTSVAQPAATTAPPTVVPPTVVPPTVAPTAVPPPAPQELMVFAAASLTESFGELVKQFEAAHPGVKVAINFAGSQQLRAQLEQGAQADVFASANAKEMNAAIQSSLIVSGTQKTFARNRLVTIFPKDNPGQIATLADLAKPGLKLVVADKAVPVGQYTLDMLAKMSKDPAYGADFADKVQKNVVSRENDVKAVLAKVRLGEADAGVVYSTDVTPAAAQDVTALAIPDQFNQLATYPIAALAKAPQLDLAQQFVDLVLSEAGQEVLKGYGFISPKAATSTGTASTGPVTIKDALDREVTFQAPPKRVAVVGKALFMVADAIYAFPEAAKSIAAIGNTAQSKLDWIPIVDPSYKDKTLLQSDAGPEQIAAVKPDAVILKSSNTEKLGKPLETLGIPVVYVDFETPEQYQRDLSTLGQLFGNTARAQELANFFQSQADKVTQGTAKLDDAKKPKVLLIYYTDRDGTVAFNVPPLSWMQTKLVEMAGGQPVWKDAQLGNGWTKVGLEQIAAWYPDQIYTIAYFNNPNDVVEKLKADPQWQKLSAVKSGKLYAFPGDYYSWDQPDTRWILGLNWLASKIHPELLPDLNIDKETRTFYSKLYNLDDAAYDQNVKPNLVGDLP
jgi:iron complex transport system substrate-binding protein